VPRWVLLLLLAALSAVPALARADEEQTEAEAATRAAARELGLAGIERYKAGDYATALDKLTRAHELVGLTTTGLWRARCLVKLGRLVEGSEALFAVTRMALPEDAKPVHVEAQRKAAEERKALQPRIPRLVIRLEGKVPDDTVVTLDGHTVPPALVGVKQPVDPGEHVIEARGAGTSADKKIALSEGQVLELPIRLVARDDDRGDVRDGVPKDATEDDGGAVLSTVGWIAAAVGGAGLVVGAVTGGLAISKKNSLEAGCPNGDCPPPLHGDVDEFETLRLTSTVSFIAGGVLAAAGITLVVTGAVTGSSASTQGPVQGRLTLTPTGLRFEGRF
jgi:hypothetical protein